MKATVMDYPLTLIPMLERAGKLFGKVEIVSRLPDHSLHRYTYADFYRRARALAAALQQAGLTRGDRVATLMSNHYVHLEAYFGIPVAGGVAHTLNLRLHPNELAYIVNHAQDRFLIVEDVLTPLYERFRDRVQMDRVLVVPISGKPIPKTYELYESFLERATGRFSYPKLAEDEPAAMGYTSGTTGQPKAVVYSHRAIVLHSFAVALADAFGLEQRDVVLPVVPLFHANGWGIPYAATMVGAKQVFPGPHLDAQSLLELFACERVTYTAGVPTIWMGILEALEKNPGRWKLIPGLRMTVGGAAASELMIRRFDELGVRVTHSWGMTEMAPAGSMSKLKSYMECWPEDARYAIRAKQGLPLPFVEARVIGENGEAPWDGKTVGELQVRGPWVAAGYYNLAGESDKWTADGWFRTGDVATIDPEGYIKILDRTKDLIKSGGEWISSVDLETALLGHPAVKEAAVIAVPHPKWQERPMAVVVLKDRASATAPELRDFLHSQFATWQVPDAFTFVKEIPRTSVGKFMKTKLREQFKDWHWEQ
jgi:fatty-acyl-CoA synthase